MQTDPLALLAQDREQARRMDDPMVDRCILGTVTRQGRSALRTLVLRDIDDRLALFYNKTSTKHREILNAGSTASLLVLLPTVSVQYRISAHLEMMPHAVIESHWRSKPNAAKRVDALYGRFPQSSLIPDFEVFETLFSATVPGVRMPRSCIGYYIVPKQIERLLLCPEPRMHERTLFEFSDRSWVSQRLVP